MTTLHEAQIDYINRWKNNAEQHFMSGDYDWVSSLVEKSGARSVLEIGCGVGYSTLALANRGINVISIDSIPEAVETTKKLLAQFGFSVGSSEGDEKSKILVKQTDVIDDFQEFSSSISSIDSILICNPGGKLETELTLKELEMLRWGKFPDEQIAEESVFNLHRWAMILAAARLAKENGKLLIVVDRASGKDLLPILEAIEKSTGLNCDGKANRLIQIPPSDGISLGESESSTDLYLVAGLYIP